MYLILGGAVPWGMLFSWKIIGAGEAGPNRAITSSVFAHISLASHMAKHIAIRVGVYIPLSLLGGILKFHSQGRREKNREQ